MAWLTRAAVIAAAAAAIAAPPAVGAPVVLREPAVRGGAAEVRPARLELIDPRVGRACRASRLLRRACPRRVMAGEYRRAAIVVTPVGRPGRRFDVLDLSGLPGHGEARGTRVRHLVLVASRYGLGRARAGAIFGAWPTGAVAALRNGLTRTTRRKPVLLARVRWNGRRGDLVLDSGERGETGAGGHLLFRWRRRGIDYSASLHASEPLRQAVATLRAIVYSMPGP